MNTMERQGHFVKRPWLATPLTIVVCGICLTFATPMCCALFEQRAAIKTDDLEPELRVCLQVQNTLFSLVKILFNINLILFGCRILLRNRVSMLFTTTKASKCISTEVDQYRSNFLLYVDSTIFCFLSLKYLSPCQTFEYMYFSLWSVLLL